MYSHETRARSGVLILAAFAAGVALDLSLIHIYCNGQRLGHPGDYFLLETEVWEVENFSGNIVFIQSSASNLCVKK